MNKTIAKLATVSIFLQVTIYLIITRLDYGYEGIIILLSLYFIVAFFVSLYIFVSNFKTTTLKVRLSNALGTLLTSPLIYIIPLLFIFISSLFPKKLSRDDIRAYDGDGNRIPVDSLFTIIPEDTIINLMNKTRKESSNTN